MWRSFIEGVDEIRRGFEVVQGVTFVIIVSYDIIVYYY